MSEVGVLGKKMMAEPFDNMKMGKKWAKTFF